MANEQVFLHRAEHYANGRLGYADGVSELLMHDILKPNDIVADIGSGTGIFARQMIEHGFNVFCVEPNEDMHVQAEKAFVGNPHFISVAASAEATTLGEHSTDVVTAASAFHWFDAERFQAECNRILKPGGILFVVFNARDYGDPFTLRQHALCMEFCKGFTSLRHGLNRSVPKLEALFGAHLNHAEFDFPLAYTKEQFLQRCLSSSYAPEPDTATYQGYIDGLRALMDEFVFDDDKIIVPNISVAYWGSLS
ncbi:MAG: class I SAM-dependent methyltransferase [Christensenella sp.]|nr:class I SAM-dependent methyltransferase [Christensenella sp.]